MNKILAKDKEHLQSLIDQEMEKNGPNCDLNHIDVSNVTSMNFLFSRSPFNGDISCWDVTNVTGMAWMFSNSKFNGDISKWDINNLTDTYCVFDSMDFLI